MSFFQPMFTNECAKSLADHTGPGPPPQFPFSLCHVHRTEIIDCLSLGGTHFQGFALLGNLHSVDITRRMGRLICSRLTLNVIYTGQLVAWTFIVRETFPTKSFNHGPQKKKSNLKAPYAQNYKKRAFVKEKQRLYAFIITIQLLVDRKMIQKRWFMLATCVNILSTYFRCSGEGWCHHWFSYHAGKIQTFK